MNDQPSPVPPVPPAVPQSKTSGLAIASLVLGLLGLTCILPVIGAIFGLVFGIIALNQIGKSGGRLTGQSQAVAGLVLGGVGLVMIPIMAAMLLPALAQAREKARQANCLSNVKGIGVACAMYAEDHQGKLPRNFDDLKELLTNTKIFICPSAKDATHYSYEFTGATNLWGVSPDVVIFREIDPNHRGRRVVLYDDGNVELVSSRSRAPGD